MGILRYCHHHLRTAVRLLRTNLREVGGLSAEYVGVLLVVGALVAALLAADIDGAITRGISNALSQLGLAAGQATAPENCVPPPGGGPVSC